MPHLFKKQVLIKHHNLEQWRVIETKGTHYAKCEFGAIHVIHKTITRTLRVVGLASQHLGLSVLGLSQEKR